MTRNVLTGVTLVFSGILLIAVSGFLAAMIVLILHRTRKGKEIREGEVDAIGFVFAVVGVLYAIVLAFVIIDVWEKMTDAGDNTYREANALVEQYWYAQSLPDAQRREIEQLCRDYAAHVIVNEWPAMRDQQRSDLTGYGLLDELRTAVENSRPVPTRLAAAGAFANMSETDKVVVLKSAEDAYSHAVEQAQVLSDARESRLSSASDGIPPVIWFVLVGGGVLVVAFTFMFEQAALRYQMIMAIGLAGTVIILLWAVYELEYPFSRLMRIDPDAYEFALARFAQITGNR